VALPHRREVEDLLARLGRPLHVAEIASRLGVDLASTPGLTAMLDDMAMMGDVNALPGNRYLLLRGAGPSSQGEESVRGPRSRFRERPGVLTINPRGFGFVASPGTGEPDVFIGAERLGGALHGDTVIVRVIRTTARGPEGEITQITRRAITRVPGVLRRRGRSAWLEPDDARMRGPITLSLAEVDLLPRAEDGDAVVATITRYPERPDEHIQGKLVAVLGKPGEPKVEIEKILVREEIEEGFPAEAIAEARAFGDHITEEQIKGREDLRALPLITIDPVDARDHDDAVYVRRASEHDGPDAAYVAWIAIADVAAYVKPNSALDAVAHRRGC